MSRFESSSSELTIPADGSSTGRTNPPSSFSTGEIDARTTTAAAAAAEPISSEDMAAIMNEQPTGAAPSAEEVGERDERDAQSSAENLLPKDKLENGLRHARMLFATGWASVTASVRDLEQTETVGKLKEGTAAIIDRSMDGLSKVGSKVAEVTDNGVKVVGAKMEEAAPTLGRWRDGVVIASEGAFASAREMTDKAMSDIKNRRGGTGAGASAPAAPAEGATASDGDDGPHTV